MDVDDCMSKVLKECVCCGVVCQGETDFCLLLAMPCGLNQEDVLNQTQALKSAFINYLQAKLAAGIINVPNPGSNQVCAFSGFIQSLFRMSTKSNGNACSPPFCSLPTFCRYFHRASFLRVTFHGLRRIFSAKSPASLHTS